MKESPVQAWVLREQDRHKYREVAAHPNGVSP